MSLLIEFDIFDKNDFKLIFFELKKSCIVNLFAATLDTNAVGCDTLSKYSYLFMEYITFKDMQKLTSFCDDVR